MAGTAMKKIIAAGGLALLTTIAPAKAEQYVSRATVYSEVARIYQAADDFKAEVTAMMAEMGNWSSERRTESVRIVNEAAADWQRCPVVNPGPICAEAIVQRLRAWRLHAWR